MKVVGSERGWVIGGKTLMAYVPGVFDFIWLFLLQMERDLFS